MQQDLKHQIHTLIDSIEDEIKLQLLTEDVEAYILETEDEFIVDEIEEIKESPAEIHPSRFVS